MKHIPLIGAFALLLVVGGGLVYIIGPYNEHAHNNCGADPGDLTLISPAFANGDPIPQRFTCDGEDISPPLAWMNVPTSTKALVLICSDPDAPGGNWDHWILYNIPPDVVSLPAGQMAVDSVLFGKALRGMNSWHRTSYGGPCPPPGKPHRYEFLLYALYAPLQLDTGATKDQILEAMRSLIVTGANLVGTYGR